MVSGACGAGEEHLGAVWGVVLNSHQASLNIQRFCNTRIHHLIRTGLINGLGKGTASAVPLEPGKNAGFSP
jgi:hypothetical protein